MCTSGPRALFDGHLEWIYGPHETIWTVWQPRNADERTSNEVLVALSRVMPPYLASFCMFGFTLQCWSKWNPIDKMRHISNSVFSLFGVILHFLHIFVLANICFPYHFSRSTKHVSASQTCLKASYSTPHGGRLLHLVCSRMFWCSGLVVLL